MSETKFTPGPWKVDSAGLIYADRNYTVAHGRYSNYLPDEQQDANVHLIATAPDLYDRVAAHADQCGACGGTGTPNRMSAMDDSRAPDGSCSVCYEDRRVMAKARGEETP